MPSGAEFHHWPVELRFLAACLRLALGTEARAVPPAPDFDWDAWLGWVARHRVGGFLHRRLPPAARDLLPPTVASRLRDLGMAAAQRALANTGELVRLASLFEARGIRTIGLKGVLLAQQLYGESGVRHAGDIDLLVAAGDIAAADLLLANAGYRRTYPDFEPTPLQWRQFLRIEHELGHVHAKTGMRVELQWRLEGLPDIPFDRLWQPRGQTALAGQTLAALPDDINALFLFAHGAKHGWASFFWLIDVALLLQHCDENRAVALLKDAQTLATTRPLLQGAALAGELLGVGLPAVLKEQLDQRSDIRALTTEAGRRLRRPGAARESPSELLRDTAYRIDLQETWLARWHLIRRRLSSPQNWKEFPLPDRWFWVYYPASPLLWIWRRLRSQRRAVGESQPPVRPRNP